MQSFKTLIMLVGILMCSLYMHAQSASQTIGCAPLEVDFEPLPDLSSYYWNFQNGASSSASHPSAVFTEAGVYEVTLRETAESAVLATINIEVLPQPILSIAPDQSSGCAPMTINFSNNSQVDPNITVESYNWIFGDGNGASALAPSHEYETPGTYSLSLNLQATEPGCSVTEVFDDLITLGGIENLNFFTIPAPAISCDPPLDLRIVNVIPNDLVSYSWDFGNGQTHEGVPAPDQLYEQEGAFDIVLTAEDELGCTATRTKSVIVIDALEAFSFPDTVCLEAPIPHEEYAIADSLAWTFPPGTTLHYDEFLDQSFISLHEAGLQEITLRAFNLEPFLCVKDTTFSVFVDQVAVEWGASPNYTCSKELAIDFHASSATNASFLWNFNEEGINVGPNVSHTYTYYDPTVYGMYGLQEFYTALIATNPSGCRDTFYRADTIFPPNALFMPDKVSGCAPLTVTIADSSASLEPLLTWNYTYGDGTSQSFSNNDDHSHTYTEAGTYEIVLDILNEAGCRDTSYTRIIEVGTPLDINFDYEDNTVCEEEEIMLGTVTSPTGVELDWVHLETPDALYVEYNGCYTRVENTAISIQGPEVYIEYEIDCTTPYTVDFQTRLENTTDILWDFGDNNSSTQENPTHTYASTGDYWVYATAANSLADCPEKVDSVLICIRDLAADFTMPAAICVGETITLDASNTQDVNPSACAGGYTWFFDLNGRPIQGNDVMLTHTFDIGGQETVSLVTKDVNGCQDTLSRALSVYGIETSLEADKPLICPPATVVFTDESTADTTLVSWQWKIGEELFSTNPSTATYTFDDIGAGQSVDVVLLLEDSYGCMATDTIQVTTYEPVSDIISDPSPLNICVGETVEFSGAQYTNAGSFLHFTWTFEDEEPIQADMLSRTYNEAGSYAVNMYYEEDASACFGELNTVVNVQAYPEAAFTSTADQTTTLCAPAQIGFLDASTAETNIAHYHWDFGNGDVSNIQNPSAGFDRGTFEVTLTVNTSFGCADETTQSYEVVGPAGDFDLDPALICKGETVTFNLSDTMDISSYTWNFGDGTTAENVSPVSHTFDDLPQATSFPVVLVLRGASDQCVLDVTKEIAVHEVFADFYFNDPNQENHCIGEHTVTNNSIGADQYTWLLNGEVISTDFEPSFTFEEGVYDVQLQIENAELGCVDEIDRELIFSSPPVLSGLNDTICAHDTISLSVLGAADDWQYEWSPQELLITDANLAHPSTSLDTTTVFYVEITDDAACVVEDSVRIEVLRPYAWQDIDTVGCVGETLAIDFPSSNELYHVFWTPEAPPTVVGNSNFSASLIIEDALACFSTSYAFNVEAIRDTIVVPNVFSPNGDEVNEVFKIYTEIDLNRIDLIDIVSFTVFNRWGQEVYYGRGPNAMWDGTVDGAAAPSDVYIYEIMVNVFKGNKTKVLQGSVTLIR